METEEMNLVRDLAVILISAGVFTIISRALKQPLILGYILAGFLIGPNIDFFPGISSQAEVHEWSEIGIIFLMFGLGLEFSFKKLLKAGNASIFAALGKFLGVFVIGYLTGRALSWSSMESIFLAGLLSMSSTTVVIKSFDEMGLKNKPFAPVVFGTLVVEDLIAILLMVLLSTMAVSNRFAGSEMLLNLGKLVFFLVLWFIGGIYIIPSLLKKTRRFINDEILLIVSIGLCFAMVTLAEGVGFSSALGAFMMGSILAETIESEHIEKLVRPIKDLFGAIFFVSVGMMVSPEVIASHWPVILLLVALVMASHILFTTVGVCISGKGLESAVHSGFSLAQLGEFGFIIAGVGVSLGVMRDFIYPVIIAVSVITTFTTPYMIKLAGPAYSLLTRKLPARSLAWINSFEKTGDISRPEQSEWKKLLKSYILRIGIYSIVILAIDLVSKSYLEPLMLKVLGHWSPVWRSILSTTATIAVMLPFLYALGVSTGSSIDHSAIKLLQKKDSNKWRLLGLIVLRAFISVGILASVIASRFTLKGWTLALFLIGGAIFVLIVRSSMRRSIRIETVFLENLNQKENLERKKSPVAASLRNKFDGFDVRIETAVVSSDCPYAGHRLKDIPVRSETGTNIVNILRGSRNIEIPGRDEFLYPGDVLTAVGTDEQLESLRRMVGKSGETTSEKREFKVSKITLNEGSYLTGLTLRDANLKQYECMVIAVYHNSVFTTTPKPDMKFMVGDIVWIVGERQSCDWIQ